MAVLHAESSLRALPAMDNDRAARLSNVTLSTTNFDELERTSSIDLVLDCPSCGSRRVAIPLGSHRDLQ